MSVFSALSKNRQGSRVGIDISSTTVKLLELSSTNGGYRVEAYSVASVPQGAVLGGVFKNEETTQIQKVPLLGDIPGVGAMFRSTINTNKKVETLIFITPRILSDVLLD
jgi:type II secretory pathway component GspD/PulD (secretin)